MTEKDYREFDESLVAPILGITRDTEERAEQEWDSFEQLAGRYGG